MNATLNSAGGKRQLRFRGDVTGSRVEELHHQQQEEQKQKAPLAQDDVPATPTATPAAGSAQQRLQSGKHGFTDWKNILLNYYYLVLRMTFTLTNFNWVSRYFIATLLLIITYTFALDLMLYLKF